MNTPITTASKSGSSTMMLVFAVLVGLTLITITGHVQTETLHGLAHDARHAAGFPCH